ncbi:malate dehydrogenase [Obelidium mucronatum]|nr:malate dehydrogenase [Obelidium mucronatum]
MASTNAKSHSRLSTVSELFSGFYKNAKAAMNTANHQGNELIKDHHHTQGTGFGIEARRANHLEGLIPPAVETLDLQVARCMARIDSLAATPLEQYAYLDRIRSEDSTLFYKVVMSNLRKVVSIIYTPTVGLACQEFSHLYTPGNAPGLFLSLANKDHLDEILNNWTGPEPDICVMTDGSRILGLGDLGINGMGIPIGKLSLYVAAGGFNPAKTLPITLDLGTNTQKHLDDPFYLGTKAPRPDDPVFYDFVEAVMIALKKKWPRLLVQFEDFSSEHAFGTLEKLRDRYFMFNDDIQGTGAVILSGFINAVRVSGIPLAEHRILFVGAGSAGVGVASQLMEHFLRAGGDGASIEKAKSHFYLVDSKGLITTDRSDASRYPHHKTLFMRGDMKGQQITSLEEAIDVIKPTALIGLSAVGGAFTEQILRKMSEINARPIVFPLSNPLANAECTFEDAMRCSNGSVIFASGTAFPSQAHPVTGTIVEPGQGNNMYIFPALGFGAVLAKASSVPDSLIYRSSVSLSEQLTDEEVDQGLLYPKLDRIREISAVLARDVILQALAEGIVHEPYVLKLYGIKAGVKFSVADSEKANTLLNWVKSQMYIPTYDNSKL